MERLSLQKQLLIYMALLIAVPLLLMMALSNYFYASGFDEQSTEFSTQMLEQVRTRDLVSSVGTVDRMLEYLAMDEDVIDYLRLPDFYSPGRIRLETAVRDRMRIFADVDPALVGGLLVAGENGLYASNDLYRITPLPPSRAIRGTRRRWRRTASACLSPGPSAATSAIYRNYSANSIVSVVRAVKDPETGELLGVVIADMRTQAIEERIRDVTLGKSGYVFVQDSAGEIVYAPVNDTVYRIRDEWLTQAPGNYTSSTGSATSCSARIRTSPSGTRWAMFPLGETPEQMASLRSFTVIAASVFIVLATVVSLRFSASFVGADQQAAAADVRGRERQSGRVVRHAGLFWRNSPARRQLQQHDGQDPQPFANGLQGAARQARGGDTHPAGADQPPLSLQYPRHHPLDG